MATVKKAAPLPGQPCPTCGRQGLTPREKWEAEHGLTGSVNLDSIRAAENQGGYAQAAIEIIRLYVAKDWATLDKAAEVWRPAIEQADAMARLRQTAQALHNHAVLSSTDERSASTRKALRLSRDMAQAAVFASHVKNGDTTEMARHKFKDANGRSMGILKAKRLRALAVQMRLLNSQERTRHTGKP